MAMGETRPGLPAGPVVAMAVGVAGLAACLTLLFLGMRAVMDVGGMCAEGGPYQVATTCPDGSAAATLLGVFGLFLFGGIGMWGGAKLGGAWESLPGVAWVGLFGLLGWNFLDYGLFNPPAGETIVWGWLLPGIMFELMAAGPLVLGIWMFRASAPERATRVRAGRLAVPLPGAGRTARPARPNVLSEPSSTDGALASIAEALGAAAAAKDAARADAAGRAAEDAGTPQASLDRLERLAGLRDRGLLSPDEYETAKKVVMRDLEARR